MDKELKDDEITTICPTLVEPFQSHFTSLQMTDDVLIKKNIAVNLTSGVQICSLCRQSQNVTRICLDKTLYADHSFWITFCIVSLKMIVLVQLLLILTKEIMDTTTKRVRG